MILPLPAAGPSILGRIAAERLRRFRRAWFRESPSLSLRCDAEVFAEGFAGYV